MGPEGRAEWQGQREGRDSADSTASPSEVSWTGASPLVGLALAAAASAPGASVRDFHQRPRGVDAGAGDVGPELGPAVSSAAATSTAADVDSSSSTGAVTATDPA